MTIVVRPAVQDHFAGQWLSREADITPVMISEAERGHREALPPSECRAKGGHLTTDMCRGESRLFAFGRGPPCLQLLQSLLEPPRK
jgi:hypothetical protein